MKEINCVKEAESLLADVMDGVISPYNFGYEMVKVLPQLLDFIENNIPVEKNK